MDLSDEFYLRTGYEPNAYDFKETSVESYTELLDSPPFFSEKGFPRTPITMTVHSRVCFVKLTEYIAITLNEKTCLSVCRRRQCPTERWDLLGTERGDLLSKVAKKHRLGLCSTNNKSKFLPSARQEIDRHEFQAAYDRSLENVCDTVRMTFSLEPCMRRHEVSRAHKTTTLRTVTKLKGKEDNRTGACQRTRARQALHRI